MKLICEIWMGELPHIRSSKVRQFFASFTLTRQNIWWIPVGMGCNLVWRETRMWRSVTTHTHPLDVIFRRLCLVSLNTNAVSFVQVQCPAVNTMAFDTDYSSRSTSLASYSISLFHCPPPVQCAHDYPYVKRPTTTLRIRYETLQ